MNLVLEGVLFDFVPEGRWLEGLRIFIFFSCVVYGATLFMI